MIQSFDPGHIPYSSVIRQHFFSFQNNAKNLDPSYRIGLWDCLGRVKLILKKNLIGLIRLFIVILEGGKPCLIAE